LFHKRLQRFGASATPQNNDEALKKAERAKRFGLPVAQTSAPSNGADLELLKKRAERFGAVSLQKYFASSVFTFNSYFSKYLKGFFSQLKATGRWRKAQKKRGNNHFVNLKNGFWNNLFAREFYNFMWMQIYFIFRKGLVKSQRTNPQPKRVFLNSISL